MAEQISPSQNGFAVKMPIRRLEIGLDAKDLKNCFWQL
jgi:hypothetical protein